MYVGTKTAVRALTAVLRKDLVGRIRVTTVDPGMVGDTEFSDVRFRGDDEKKDAVYRGVRYLTPDDVADCILWAVTRPAHMVVDEIVVKPLQQASQDAIVRDGPLMPLTILEGSTFCVSDERGDIVEPTMGLFAHDTRFLSHWALTINGAPPLILSSRKVEYYSAAFFLRNPVVGGLEHDEISIARERFIGDAMQELLVVSNHSPRRVAFDLALEIGNDFADIFAVKAYDFSFGDRAHAKPLPPPVAPVYEAEDNQFVFAVSDNGFHGLTQVVLSERGETDGSKVTYRIELEPRETWRLRADVIPAPDGMRTAVHVAERRFGEELARVRASLAAWRLRVPQLRGSWDDLSHSFRQSVADLSSLRMDEDPRVPGQLPAAGMPWFMTVFGRDTLITCLQTLLFGPELAQNALAVLAELQAGEDDPTPTPSPGRSSTRFGTARAPRPGSRATTGPSTRLRST